MFRSTLSSLREYITPVSHVSTFRETGEITPEEFVQAGDYLVYKFPTWSWASAPPNKRRSFLPPEKQYLITKHVPSHYRASTYENADTRMEALDEDPDGWTATSFGADGVSQGSSATENTKSHSEASKSSYPEEDNIIDIEDIENDEEDEDENAYIPPSSGFKSNSAAGSSSDTGTTSGGDTGNNSLRSYNLFITYSTSYRVPKLYLSGFSGDGTPLSPQQMFEDIMADYRNKTATIEKAPFEDDLTSVSIHPCRHASVMKTLLSRAEARRIQKLEEQQHQQGSDVKPKGEDDWEEIEESDSHGVLRVDQYLVVFLKFISSVTPGIEHDNTMSVL